MITDIRHFWNRSLWSWIVVLHCKKCHPVLYIDIIKCLFIDDWVSFVNSLHIEMEALEMEALYKITKIVRALWLAERRVCMRVCKHGSSVKMFCFSRANHASTNLKKFSRSKLDTFTLFTHFFRLLKLGKSSETCCVNFFSLKLTF